MTTLSCKVVSVEALTDTVHRVILAPETAVHFRAGQYLLVVMDENDKRPFSLASTPEQTQEIELHIGAAEANLYTLAVLERIQQQSSIMIDLPHGDAWLREDSSRPVLLIAGGTGFSYTRSILLTLLSRQSQQSITLYWGVRERQHLYALDELQQLAARYPDLQVISVVEHPCDQWQGREGNVITAVMQDFDSLENHDIYIAGRFDMAKLARVLLCTDYGAIAEHMYSDAFAFD